MARRIYSELELTDEVRVPFAKVREKDGAVTVMLVWATDTAVQKHVRL